MGLTVEHHGSSRTSDEALEVMEKLWNYKSGDPRPFRSRPSVIKERSSSIARCPRRITSIIPTSS